MSARLPVPAADDSGGSQGVKAQLRLREMILAGELPGGARIAELAIVDKLGVSRTPIRAAGQLAGQDHLAQAQLRPHGLGSAGIGGVGRGIGEGAHGSDVYKGESSQGRSERASRGFH